MFPRHREHNHHVHLVLRDGGVWEGRQKIKWEIKMNGKSKREQWKWVTRQNYNAGDGK